MRVLEYKIHKQIFVKATITSLAPCPIVNDSDNFYLVIPTLNSELPDDILFIQEAILVSPHTNTNYIPKVVKLGVTLSQSVASQLPRGIEIKLIIFDNINNEIQSVTNVDYIKAKNDRKKKDDNENKDNTKTYIYDGQKIKVDKDQYNILKSIDQALERKEKKPNVLQQEKNQNTQVYQLQPSLHSSTKDDSTTNVLSEVPIKRGRGRPRKTPVAKQEAEDNPSILQSILSEDETI